MSRSHARSSRGERVYSQAPYRSGERTNLIAALSTLGVQAPWLITGGSVNTATFIAYVEHILCPTLLAGQIVILDNYSIHTHNKIRELIEARGCTLLFLPTYSPDFNPIENAFSKTKALLKQEATSGSALASYQARLRRHLLTRRLCLVQALRLLGSICLKISILLVGHPDVLDHDVDKLPHIIRPGEVQGAGDESVRCYQVRLRRTCEEDVVRDVRALERRPDPRRNRPRCRRGAWVGCPSCCR